MIAADYIDNLACPVCGWPARRIGRWKIVEGEWQFYARPISSRVPITAEEREDRKDPHRWTRKDRLVSFENKDGTRATKRVEEYHYIVDFECSRSAHDPSDSRVYDCHLMQCDDCRPYKGPHHEWMDAPSRPEHKTVDTSGVVGGA